MYIARVPLFVGVGIERGLGDTSIETTSHRLLLRRVNVENPIVVSDDRKELY